jgi:hypothetical protein
MDTVLSLLLPLDFYIWFVNADTHDCVGGPHFWRDIRTAASKDDVESLLQEIMDADDAPLQNDALCPWPSGTMHALDRVHNADLAQVLNKIEFMIVLFYQKGHLTLQFGHLLFEMLTHPEFNFREVLSKSIVSAYK